MKEAFTDDFFLASTEYFWLLNRGYPQKGSLRMVGDKFMLTKTMRQVLFRGISSQERARERRKKIGRIRNGDLVLVDTYNVLFTVNNYLLGKHLFISNDGMLRDAGEMRGRIVNKPVFSRSHRLLLEVLKKWSASTFILYLDEPVPYSGRLSLELSKEMVQMEIQGEARTVKSPDYMLMHEPGDAICTSDSVILDFCNSRIIDLPRILLEKYFNPDFPALLV